MLQMHGQCYHIIRMHLQRPESIAKRFPERHHSEGGGGLVINLVQRRNGQDRTKILENNKNIQSIISVNTNILLRRFRLKFLRMMCSRNASTSRTTCVIHISAAQNSREHFYFHKTV
jgi:hypothetical protein